MEWDNQYSIWYGISNDVIHVRDCTVTLQVRPSFEYVTGSATLAVLNKNFSFILMHNEIFV